MDKAEDLLLEIARIEKDIEDVLEYRAGLFADGPALTGWSALIAGVRRRMDARQAQRHLQYLRLERDTAYHSYETLNETTRRRPA